MRIDFGFRNLDFGSMMFGLRLRLGTTRLERLPLFFSVCEIVLLKGVGGRHR